MQSARVEGREGMGEGEDWGLGEEMREEIRGREIERGEREEERGLERR